MAKKPSEQVRLERVRQLFYAYTSGPHDETGVLLFFAWLEKYAATYSRLDLEIRTNI